MFWLSARFGFPIVEQIPLCRGKWTIRVGAERGRQIEVERNFVQPSNGNQLETLLNSLQSCLDPTVHNTLFIPQFE